MAWRSAVLAVDANDAERLGDALLEAGAASVSVEDADAGTASETPLFGEPGHTSAVTSWRHSLLIALCDADADIPSLIASAAAAAEVETPRIVRIDEVADQDWVRLTQSQFDPIRISDRLWIVPSWHVPPDPTAINLVLDPGIAFGTGSHPTTRMCLQWLERTIAGGEHVLDYGCGSGILAIAAAKLGAATALGVDIDPAAVEQARMNAAANDAAQATFIDTARSFSLKADVVVANILANPLKLLAPVLAQHTRPGGRIALAGVLVHQVEEVAAAYSPSFDMRVETEMDGWSLLVGIRRIPT